MTTQTVEELPDRRRLSRQSLVPYTPVSRPWARTEPTRQDLELMRRIAGTPFPTVPSRQTGTILPRTAITTRRPVIDTRLHRLQMDTGLHLIPLHPPLQATLPLPRSRLQCLHHPIHPVAIRPTPTGTVAQWAAVTDTRPSVLMAAASWCLAVHHATAWTFVPQMDTPRLVVEVPSSMDQH
jgi:hypothetical protein